MKNNIIEWPTKPLSPAKQFALAPLWMGSQIQRKSKVAAPPDEGQAAQMLLSIDAVIGGVPVGGCQNADPLVKPDGDGFDAGFLRQISDAQFSRHVLTL